MDKLPRFQSAFLDHLCRRIASRGKALKSHGKLEWITTQPDEFEWLTVNILPLVGHACVFQFVEDNRVSIFVRSRHRKNRGKILFSVEDLRLVDNAESIVEAIETTIVKSPGLDSIDPARAAADIRAAWSVAQVRVT